MPKQYEAIKQRIMESGVSEAEASRRAAKIYNAQNPEHPVGPSYHRKTVPANGGKKGYAHSVKRTSVPVNGGLSDL